MKTGRKKTGWVVMLILAALGWLIWAQMQAGPAESGDGFLGAIQSIGQKMRGMWPGGG